MLVAKVVIKSVAMKKFRIKRRSLFVTGSMEMKQPCALMEPIRRDKTILFLESSVYLHSFL